jgi:hypothetical protein
MSKAKRNSLLFLAAAGILILLLVMSVPGLTLSSGESFSFGQTDVSLPGVGGSVPGTNMLSWILRGLLALSVVCLPIYIIYSLSNATGRRRLVKNIILVLVLFWFAYYLREHPIRFTPGEPETVVADPSEIGLEEEAPVAVFSESEAPSWLAVVVILAASAFGVGLLAAGVRLYQRRAARRHPVLHPLAEAAQDTIDSLLAGADFRTAILRCYYEMTRVVKEERSLEREAAMTPREFETYLIKWGLPQNALETLTRLFERARYGSELSQTDDETTAFTCLTQIVDFCKAAKIGYEEH